MPLVTRSSQNANVWVGDADPSAPVDGDLYSDTADNNLQQYDGTTFNRIGGVFLADIEATQASAAATFQVVPNTLTREYYILDFDIVMSGAANLGIRLNANSGAVYVERRFRNGTYAATGNSSDVNIGDSNGGGTQRYKGRLFLYRDSSNDQWVFCWIACNANEASSGGGGYQMTGTGKANITAALTSIDFVASTGNITTDSKCKVLIEATEFFT